MNTWFVTYLPTRNNILGKKQQKQQLIIKRTAATFYLFSDQERRGENLTGLTEFFLSSFLLEKTGAHEEIHYIRKVVDFLQKQLMFSVKRRLLRALVHWNPYTTFIHRKMFFTLNFGCLLTQRHTISSLCSR